MLPAEWFDLDAKFHEDPAFDAFQNAYASQQYDAASESLSSLISQYPGHPKARLLKAHIFEALGQYEDARRAYSAVVEECRHYIAQFEEETAAFPLSWSNVIEITTELIFSKLAHYKMMDQALFLSAATFDLEHQSELFLENLEKAVAMRGNSVHLGIQLALLYADLGRNQHAAEACRKCLETNPYDAYKNDWRDLALLCAEFQMNKEKDAANAKADQYELPGGEHAS